MLYFKILRALAKYAGLISILSLVNCADFEDWNKTIPLPLKLPSPNPPPWVPIHEWPVLPDYFVDGCSTSTALWGLIENSQNTELVKYSNKNHIDRYRLNPPPVKISALWIEGMNKMVCISDNEIWVSTRGGQVYRYNGVTWQLQSFYADRIYGDKQGHLYVMDREGVMNGPPGLYRWENDKLKLFKSGAYHAVKLDDPQDLWLMNGKISHCVDGVNWQDYDTEIIPNWTLKSWATRAAGIRRAIGLSNFGKYGLFKWQNDHWEYEHTIELDPMIYQPIPDDFGSWWFSTARTNVVHHYNLQNKIFDTKDLHCQAAIAQLWADKDNNQFALCDSMIFQLRQQLWYSLANDLQHTTLWKGVAAPSEQDIWLVGPQSVTTHFDGTNWQFVANEQGGNYNLNAVWARSSNEIYAAGEYAAVLVNRGRGLWQEVDQPLKGSNIIFTNITGDNKRVWITGSERRILKLEQGQWTGLQLPSQGISSEIDSQIVKSCVMRDGQLWVITSKQLWNYKDERWAQYTLPSKFLNTDPACKEPKNSQIASNCFLQTPHLKGLACEPNDTLAIWLDGWLLKWKNATWQIFSWEGLLKNSGLLSQYQDQQWMIRSSSTKLLSARIWFKSGIDNWQTYRLDQPHYFSASQDGFITGKQALNYNIYNEDFEYKTLKVWKW